MDIDRVSTAAALIRLNATALEVTAAFEDEGIDSLLIKGPVTNAWLYGDALARRYGDIDLLVAPADDRRARAVLRGLGFEDYHERILGIYRPDYESTWVSDRGVIDLHTRLAGVPYARANDSWVRFRCSSEPFTLHGRDLRTLSIPARVLLLCLHAARSGGQSRPARELSDGLERVDPTVWAQAAGLARELDAVPCFCLGLRRVPGGESRLAGLAVTPTSSLESLLLEADSTQRTLVLAMALQRPRGQRASTIRRLFQAGRGRRGQRLRVLVRLPADVLTITRTTRRLKREGGGPAHAVTTTPA